MDESKYTTALEIVTAWIAEFELAGYAGAAAIRALLILLETGVLAARTPEIEAYRTEIEAVLRSRLGETRD